MADQEKPAEGAAKPAAGGHPPPKPPAVMAATPWEGELVTEVKNQFGDQILEASTYLGQNFFVVKRASVLSVLEYLKLEADFDYLVDLTAAHYPNREEQFDVFYILYSFARNLRIRVKTRIKEDELPDSVVSVYVTADWLEREVFDMYGIRFANHPDLRRLLLPEDWSGYPLRKDYGLIQMDNRWVQENLNIESGQ